MQTETAQAARTANPALPPQARALYTVRQFSEKYPAFSQGSLRNLIFLASARHATNGKIPGNGLDVALVRIGRKLLIDVAKFYEWVDAQQGGV